MAEAHAVYERCLSAGVQPNRDTVTRLLHAHARARADEATHAAVSADDALALQRSSLGSLFTSQLRHAEAGARAGAKASETLRGEE